MSVVFLEKYQNHVYYRVSYILVCGLVLFSLVL